MLPFGDRIEGGAFMPKLRQYRREQWLPKAELERLQRERLAKVLEFARARVPYYRDLPAPLSDPFEDLRQFPILRKSDLRQRADDLLAAPKRSLIASSGSGSSGVQSTIYLDKAAQASQRAMQLLWFEWSGYNVGDTVLQTGMTMNRSFVKAAKDRFLRTLYIPAFELDAASLARIFDELQKNPRDYLFGYASSLFVLAQTALELGIDSIRFRRAVSWGDKLFPHYRERIRRAFGCETLDTYGCTEGAMIASQCLEKRFHLSINQTFVEAVDDNGDAVRAGEIGKILVTRLDNFAMPLVRYYLGDLIELENENQTPCRCGRESPALRRVVGRDTDIVKTGSGKQMIVHFFTGIFEHIPQIRQFKVVQRDLNRIEIEYIPDAGFEPQLLDQIERKIHDYLREQFPIKWKPVAHIAATNSGKPQIIESFLKQSLGH